jgi:hypothetical protein
MNNLRVFNIEDDKLEYNFQYKKEEKSNINEMLNNNSNLNMDHIRRVALWKLNRVINIPDEILKELSKIAIDKDLKPRDKKSIDVIKELVKCEGIGFPMASTILKFIRPDIYPIIDIRAYRVLFCRSSEKPTRIIYTLELYLNYIDKITEISIKQGIAFNAVDEQLYCFDKELNKNI